MPGGDAGGVMPGGAARGGASPGQPGSRWVCLDVGETLIDETRVWSIWADVLDVPRLTFMAALGAAVTSTGNHRDVFSLLGVDRWRERMSEVEARYGGFQAQDLYPDALPAIDGLRNAGYRISVMANQPAARSAQLQRLGVRADAMEMSDAMGVSKPDPAFFARALALMGDPDPASVAYVGDRVDNDVIPAAAAGLRPVWLRRGPWGRLTALPDTEPDGMPGAPPGGARVLVVDSLSELVERIGEAWA
jgi:FMN hydrolase / 5-amino-6-(5-phospho-D-ribitylamino)uracil phosphatase